MPPSGPLDGMNADEIMKLFNDLTMGTMMEQSELRAREAASKRTEDPLKNWTRPPRDDCPICLLPLPVSEKQVIYRNCCGYNICKGCTHQHLTVLMKERVGKKKAVEIIGTCPMCRTPAPEDSDKAVWDLQKKYAKQGRVQEMFELGLTYFYGENGVREDKKEGLKWINRAADKGSGKASHFLGFLYTNGDEMVCKDIDKALVNLQAAADRGVTEAFKDMAFNLIMEKGDIENAMLNFRKAAVCGVTDEELHTEIREGFRAGFITKDEYAFTLREHQKVCNEMESKSRREARKYTV